MNIEINGKLMKRQHRNTAFSSVFRLYHKNKIRNNVSIKENPGGPKNPSGFVSNLSGRFQNDRFVIHIFSLLNRFPVSALYKIIETGKKRTLYRESECQNSGLAASLIPVVEREGNETDEQ